MKISAVSELGGTQWFRTGSDITYTKSPSANVRMLRGGKTRL